MILVALENLTSLFQMIGVVSQEPSLFHGSIRENIRLGRAVSDEEIERAARSANAHEFIIGLEKVSAFSLIFRKVSL